MTQTSLMVLFLAAASPAFAQQTDPATEAETATATTRTPTVVSEVEGAIESTAAADVVATTERLDWPPTGELAPTTTVPSGNLWESVFPELPGDGWTVLGMIGVLVFSLLLVSVVRRLRDGLPSEGLLPTALAAAHLVLQIFALLTAAGVVGRLLPPALEPAVPWAIVAVAVAIGWSSRDILPDVIAAVVIAFERKIRRGTWIALGELEGLVEGRGLRAVWVRDGSGNRVAIPNRRLLTADVAMQEVPGPVHEVVLRVDGDSSSSDIRRALVEASITSPFIRSDGAPIVRQDGSDPRMWHVRAQLLEMRFAERFEGDLLERTEDVLAARRAAAPSE